MIKMYRMLTVTLAFGLFLVGCSKTDEINEQAQEQTEEVQEKIVEEKESVKSEYLDVLGNSLQVFSYNMNLIHNQYAKAEEELLLFIDADWRMQTMEYFDTISAEADVLAQVEVPEEYQEIHNKMEEAIALNGEARDVLFSDLSKATDIETLELGATKMSESVLAIEEVNKLMLEKQK
jgi:hypothetical protein